MIKFKDIKHLFLDGEEIRINECGEYGQILKEFFNDVWMGIPGFEEDFEPIDYFDVSDIYTYWVCDDMCSAHQILCIDVRKPEKNDSEERKSKETRFYEIMDCIDEGNELRIEEFGGRGIKNSVIFNDHLYNFNFEKAIEKGFYHAKVREIYTKEECDLDHHNAWKVICLLIEKD